MNRWSVLVAGTVLLAAGCGGSGCDEWVAAYTACAEAYGVDPGLDASVCEDAPEDSDDYYTCLADAYASQDCSTDEGWLAAADAATDCTY